MPKAPNDQTRQELGERNQAMQLNNNGIDIDFDENQENASYEYFDTNISEFDYGLTLTNPPNIECGTLYIIIPILKITKTFLDSSLLDNKQNLSIQEISKLEGIQSVSFKIGKRSIFNSFNLSKLMRSHFDKLTQDFLNSYYTKINPK